MTRRPANAIKKQAGNTGRSSRCGSRRSLLYEQRQRRGETVQIILFAHGADFTVAVKSGQAQRPKFLLHQFGVVVRLAEKVFPAPVAAANAAAVNRRPAAFFLRVFE